MGLDRAEVERIASLARLEIGDDSIVRTAAELSACWSSSRRSSASIWPAASPPPSPQRFAAAQGRDRRPTTEARDRLAAAPEAEDGFFLVPPIVENVNP